jgi:hypothetical protein
MNKKGIKFCLSNQNIPTCIIREMYCQYDKYDISYKGEVSDDDESW